jgi:glycosyltransferase involved in cell wall biosynthesis
LKGRSRMEKPLVSVVVIGYKRPHLLKKTVETLLAKVSYKPLEMILCDDGSPAAMKEQMRQLPFDVFLLADRNEGMGRNTNKGIQAAKGEFILHLQDDWECLGPPDLIEAAMEVLNEFPDVGLVRYRPVEKNAPYRTVQTKSGRTVRIYESSVFESTGEYIYSDRPHLKRRSFHEQLGLYPEGIPIPTTEIEFCKRYMAHPELKAAFVEGYESFQNNGDAETFNPSIRRGQLKKRLESHWHTRFLLRIYQRVRGRKP